MPEALPAWVTPRHLDLTIQQAKDDIIAEVAAGLVEIMDDLLAARGLIRRPTTQSGAPPLTTQARRETPTTQTMGLFAELRQAAREDGQEGFDRVLADWKRKRAEVAVALMHQS